MFMLYNYCCLSAKCKIMLWNDKMQLIGIDVDKNAIQRIECGKRFVTDIEIAAFSKVFDICLEELLKE